MAYQRVRISNLADELVTLILALPSISGRGFYVYNSDKELPTQVQAGYPQIAIGWEGTEIRGSGGSAGPGGSARSAQVVRVLFSVTVAIEYQPLAGDDTKDTATDLIEDIRDAVLGYQGANKRPFLLLGEQPVYGIDQPGVIFYGQMWETSLAYDSNPT